MKIISLNTWGGRAGRENLLKFFEKYKDTDIFCLQEIWNGGEHMGGRITGGVILSNISYRLLTDIGNILTNHKVYFKPHYHDWYGLAVFVKKNIKVVDEGDIFVHKEKGWSDKTDEGNHARNIQWITVEDEVGQSTVINFHGLWNGQGKGDSEDRILQSDNIINFIKDLATPLILMGDFNLGFNTKSLKKFEDFGLRNLIKEYKISSTRTSLYTKPEKFADYVFLSQGIGVKNFRVLPDEVSDHAPLFLEI